MHPIFVEAFVLARQVAQVSNLLYRRASSLRASRVIARVHAVGGPADWKSAIQQVGNLRYLPRQHESLDKVGMRPFVSWRWPLA